MITVLTNITGDNFHALRTTVILYPTINFASKLTLVVIHKKILAKVLVTHVQEKTVGRNLVIYSNWNVT
jgi:hypothetical protein